MSASSDGNDAPDILEELARLHQKWEAKTRFKELHEGVWLPAVLFGIEVGRHRIAEEIPTDVTALDRLMGEWRLIWKLEKAGPAKEALKGIDFGIRLVSACVQRYLNQLQENSVRPKPPASANNGKARFGHKRRPRSQT
jgi:hypothetical protein